MHLVKIIKDEDGLPTNDDSWHLVNDIAGSNHCLCDNQVFGLGEGKAVYKEKFTGKITCAECIEIVKWFKSIKL